MPYGVGRTKVMRNARIVGTACALVDVSSATGQATVTNGSFETGNFTGWIVNDIADPFDAADVLPAGTSTLFSFFLGPNVVIPSDGNFAASHGFDGDGLPAPGEISIAQDLGTPVAGEIIAFDFRAGWDLISFVGLEDRNFDLVIEPAGGGTPLGVFPQLTATGFTATPGGPNTDTGPLTGAVDLTPFAGTAIRANFRWTVPEAFSGPANAQLDNVRIIPAPGTAAVLGLAALTRRRRR